MKVLQALPRMELSVADEVADLSCVGRQKTLCHNQIAVVWKESKNAQKKKQGTGSGELSTTTAREQNRALGHQLYGRYPYPGKHRKIISTIAFARSAKN